MSLPYITSEANNVGDRRMYAAIHDTGLIGIGEMLKSGKFSAHLYEVKDVREHAEEMIALCDLADKLAEKKASTTT